MVDIKSMLHKRNETVTKTEFQHFIAEFEEFREGMIKKTFKMEQDLEAIKDCLNQLQDELKASGALKRKIRNL